MERTIPATRDIERPSLDLGADANWLVGEAEMTADAGGSFAGRRGVALRTEELVAFRAAPRRQNAVLD
jgi:hypothetical protein